MNRITDRQRLVRYAQDAVTILDQSLHICAAGQTYFYRVAAVQLRLLLCDTTRRHEQIHPIALAGQLWPDLRLPALDDEFSQPHALLVDVWLEQKLPQTGLSLRQFIRHVCDQDGGAHVDLRQHTLLPDQFPIALWICNLGKIVKEVLTTRLAAEQPGPYADHFPMPSQQ
ncbi:hypothetical protein FDZ73_21100 [bacterium]|nr:MAG: hypothetical protein FDZ73_21100 [bacterium]